MSRSLRIRYLSDLHFEHWSPPDDFQPHRGEDLVV